MSAKQERYILFHKKNPIKPRWLNTLFLALLLLIVSSLCYLLIIIFIDANSAWFFFLVPLALCEPIREHYAYVKVYEDNQLKTWGTLYILPKKFDIVDIVRIEPSWQTNLWGKYLRLRVTLKNGRKRDLYVEDYEQFLKLMHERNPKIQIMPVPPMY